MARTLACVDTDLCIDYLRGDDPRAAQLEKAAATFDLCMTAITAYELLLGQRRMQRRQDLTGLFRAIPVIPFHRRAAERAATVQATLMKRGRAIGLPDTLIAGTCLAEATPLLTHNLVHFERVEGLRVIDPATL